LDKYQVYKWVNKVPAGGKTIDTKWVVRKKEEKATTGVLVMCGRSPLRWTTRKQDVTTLSSTEAEYTALGVEAQDAM